MSSSSSSLPPRWLVQVCQHRSCQRNQSEQVLAAFRQYQSVKVLVAGSGCMGQCSSGPTVCIMPDNTWYCRVSPDDVEKIVSQHLQSGRRVQERLHPRFHPSEE